VREHSDQRRVQHYRNAIELFGDEIRARESGALIMPLCAREQNYFHLTRSYSNALIVKHGFTSDFSTIFVEFPK
jgi:hypothetical protein